MASTTFVDRQTPINAEWLNTVNRTVYQDTFNVKNYGATGDGVTNDTAAFTATRAASGGKYYIPPGTYLVNSTPDIWSDSFFSGPNTYLVISGITYNISNAFLGPLRYVSLSNILYGIVNAKTDNTIQLWQDGSSGTATYFYRGIAFSNDSHFIQAKPLTNGGSCDLLLQRSSANADPDGNRFNFTFEENLDRWTFSYATTASGAPVFDSFMQVVAGTTPTISFPALKPTFEQGWSIKYRAIGTFQLDFVPETTSSHRLKQVGGSNTNFIEFSDNKMTFLPSTSVPSGGSTNTGLLMSSTVGLGIYFGSGIPTVSAAKGSLYMRTDGSSTSTRMYVNTDGGVTWTNVVTAL